MLLGIEVGNHQSRYEKLGYSLLRPSGEKKKNPKIAVYKVTPNKGT